MAITYHAGRRIQGLEYTASTLTTSGFAQTWGKDPSNSQFEVSSGRINFLDNTSSTGDRTWLDLQSIIGSAVSTTKWVLRFKFNFSTLTSGSYYYEFDAGLSDTTVNNATNQNFIGVRVLPSGFNNLWRPRTTDGTSYPRGGSSANITQSFSTGTDYYCEIKRTSSSNWSISLSTTDAYDGDIQDDSYTDASGATGLRYFKFGDAVTNTGTGFTMQGVCDVLEFYNDTNTVATASGDEKPTNVQVGSRFEETDTRKMYNFADVSTSGLKAYWKFNNSTVSNLSTSSDSLGSSADLALTGATVTASGGTSPLGYEGVFDGSDDFGKAGTSVSQFNFLHNQSALWTIAFWYKANDLTQGQFLINTSDNLKVADNIGFLLSQGANDSLGIILGTGGGASSETNHSTSTSYVPDTTTWHFYCLTFDESLSSANLNVRRDNANLETFNKEHTNSNSNATYALHVGGMSGFTGDLNGRISELSIWNRVLTTNEQTLLYNSGTGATVDNAKGWQEIGS